MPSKLNDDVEKITKILAKAGYSGSHTWFNCADVQNALATGDSAKIRLEVNRYWQAQLSQIDASTEVARLCLNNDSQAEYLHYFSKQTLPFLMWDQNNKNNKNNRKV